MTIRIQKQTKQKAYEMTVGHINFIEEKKNMYLSAPKTNDTNIQSQQQAGTKHHQQHYFPFKRIPNLWSYGEIYLWSEKKKNKWGNIWFLHHLNLEIFWGKKGDLTKAKDTRLIVLQQWGCKGWSNIWVRLLKYKRTIETCNGKIPKEWVHMDRMSKQWKLKVAMWQIKTTPSTSYDLGRSLPLGSIRFGPALISMPANRALGQHFSYKKEKQYTYLPYKNKLKCKSNNNF